MPEPDILWREIWPEEDHEDYTATHNGAYVGRVYKRLAAGFDKRLYTWNLGWPGPDPQGRCASRREAMAMVEERYAKHLVYR